MKFGVWILLRIAASIRVAIQMEIILTFDKPSYCRLGRFLYPYDCMKNLKNSTKKNWKFAKEKLIFGETWKTWKKEETWISKVDFVHDWQPRITLAIVDNHDNVRFWLSSILLSSSKVISWSISNVLIPEYRKNYFKTHINYLYLMGSTWLLLVYRYFT